MKHRSPMLCAHANECPQSCRCDERCYCRRKGGMCARRLTMSIEGVAITERIGADIERRRIRAAQAEALRQLRDLSAVRHRNYKADVPKMLGLLDAIDNATRATRTTKRKRGKP